MAINLKSAASPVQQCIQNNAWVWSTETRFRGFIRTWKITHGNSYIAVGCSWSRAATNTVTTAAFRHPRTIAAVTTSYMTSPNHCTTTITIQPYQL